MLPVPERSEVRFSRKIEMAGGGDIHIFAGADKKGNGRGFITDAADQGAAVGGVEGILAEQVFPSPGKTIGRSRSPVAQSQVARGGEVEVVGRGDLDAGVGPIAAIDFEGIGALARLQHRGIRSGRLDHFHRRMGGAAGRCGRLGQRRQAENQQTAKESRRSVSCS